MIKRFDEFRINESDSDVTVYNIKDIVKDMCKRWAKNRNVDVIQKNN